MNYLTNNIDLNSEFILNSLQSPIIVVNSSKKTIIYCNNATEIFLEISKSKILGKTIEDLFKQDSYFISLVEKSIQSGRNLNEFNISINTPKKNSKVSVSISKIETNNNFYSIILNDLSKNLELSKQFNFVKSAQSVSSLVSMLSHEIKNPLSGIKGAAQIIQKRITFRKKDLNLIKLIDSETERIKKLLNSLENFTDNRPIKKSILNINQLLRYAKNSVEVVYDKKKILFIENFDPSLPNIIGNKDHLIQLFFNLLKNSSEAINRKNGLIKISTRYEHGNLPIKVYIEDNGVGVPDELKDNIFDAFITNKINGKGLGLPICAKIIQSHHGLIEFDSMNGKTIFKVMFDQKRK